MIRSAAFKARPHPRYWWFQSQDPIYEPPIFSILSDDEWDIMLQWFDETEQKHYIGECNVPVMCFLQGLIMGSNITRIVQCGTYAGYSTLLLGFFLKHIGALHSLITIDLSREMSDFTGKYVRKAKLDDYVRVYTSDSSDPSLIATSTQYLKGSPQLIFIDSSHQYQHTLKELDLWFPPLQQNGLILLHDTSVQAVGYDQNGAGGVQKALDEWIELNHNVASININRTIVEGTTREQIVYADGCGLGIIQKR